MLIKHSMFCSERWQFLSSKSVCYGRRNIDNPHRHGSEVSRYLIRCKRDWLFPRISLKIWLMLQSDDPALDAMLNKPRRCVALRRDDDEFVITFQPEDSIAFRSHDAKALRKVCAFLRWKIVSDTSLTADDLR